MIMILHIYFKKIKFKIDYIYKTTRYIILNHKGLNILFMITSLK